MRKTFNAGARRVRLLVSRRGAVARLGALAGLSMLVGIPALAQTRRLRGGVRWAIFYGMDVDPAELEPFELIVLDPNFTRPISSLKRPGVTLLGYLSMGEFNRTKPQFSRLQSTAALIGQNPHWPDSYTVDTRHEAWRSLVLNELVPDLVDQGFDGLFLDTLDSPPHLEQTNPELYRGMSEAAVSLVCAIRDKYPRMPLMINRGYALLPQLIDTVDAVVAESMITSYDPETKAYVRVVDDTVARHLALLRPAREAQPELPVFSLDYWEPADIGTLRSLYARERELGHSPYVATVLLDQVVAEPLR